MGGLLDDLLIGEQRWQQSESFIPIVCVASTEARLDAHQDVLSRYQICNPSEFFEMGYGAEKTSDARYSP